MSEPTRTPSARNSTRDIPEPPVSEAVAASATEPDTIAPLAGDVIDTVGAVVSAGVGTVTDTEEDAELPATSNAVAWIV